MRRGFVTWGHRRRPPRPSPARTAARGYAGGARSEDCAPDVLRPRDCILTTRQQQVCLRRRQGKHKDAARGASPVSLKKLIAVLAREAAAPSCQQQSAARVAAGAPHTQRRDRRYKGVLARQACRAAGLEQARRARTRSRRGSSPAIATRSRRSPARTARATARARDMNSGSTCRACSMAAAGGGGLGTRH